MTRRNRRLLILAIVAAAGLITLILAAVAFQGKLPACGLGFRKCQSDLPKRPEFNAELALKCVADFRRHDPVNDADRDIARGDLTPIGHTYTTHHDPEPSARYSGACANRYAGYYQATGKWFAHSFSSFSMKPFVDEYSQCRRAADEYARRYNRRMVERAPAAVRKFCESQTLDQGERMGAATDAVFRPALREHGYVDGKFSENIDGVPYLTKAVWLVDTDTGPALVTKSIRREKAASCRLGDDECFEILGIAYLAEHGQAMSFKRRWPNVMRLKQEGWSGGGLSCCGHTPRTRHSELTVSEGIRKNRCRSTRETLVELAPGGPVIRGVIPTDKYIEGEPVAYSGRPENVVRGVSFDVVESAADIREHYEFDGSRFVGPERSRFSCGE